MTKLGFALIIPFWVSSAMAEPCVGPAFDAPFEDATNVVIGLVDVPSPLVPGFWQQGTLGDWQYTLFANHDGLLQSAKHNPGWKIVFSCSSGAGKQCDQSIDGLPPERAIAAARRLQACLTGEVLDVASSQINAKDEQETPAETPAKAAPCGIATLPDERAEITLQKLLVMVGTEPGVADGIVGSKTRAALTDALGENATTLPLLTAISLLNDIACKRPR